MAALVRWHEPAAATRCIRAQRQHISGSASIGSTKSTTRVVVLLLYARCLAKPRLSGIIAWCACYLVGRHERSIPCHPWRAGLLGSQGRGIQQDMVNPSRLHYREPEPIYNAVGNACKAYEWALLKAGNRAAAGGHGGREDFRRSKRKYCNRHNDQQFPTQDIDLEIRQSANPIRNVIGES